MNHAIKMIELAIDHRWYDVIKMVIQKNLKHRHFVPLYIVRHALDFAFKCDRVTGKSAMEFLIKNNLLCDEEHYNIALMGALKYGNIDAIEILLKDGHVCPSFGENYPLRLVCQRHSWYIPKDLRMKIVCLLLDDGRVNIFNGKPCAALTCALGHDWKILNLMLSKFAGKFPLDKVKLILPLACKDDANANIPDFGT